MAHALFPSLGKDLLGLEGLTREQISSEGYWRPGRIGGHDHVND